MDTYAKKQQQLHSQVLEQTDYQGYAPISKKPVDIDNFGAQKTTIAKGRKVDDVFKAGVRGFEPVKNNYDGYNARDMKQSFLSSQIGPQYERERPQNIEQPVQTFTVAGRETKATK